VRDVAARVAEHEVAQLLRGELAAVALALDQLGRPDHGSHTNTTAWRDTTSGRSKAGRRPASSRSTGQAEMCRWAASRSAKVTVPRTSRRSTIVKWRRSAPSAFSALKPSAGA